LYQNIKCVLVSLSGWTAEDIAQRKGNVQCSKRIAEYQSEPPGSTPRGATSAQAAGDDEGLMLTCTL